MTQTVFFPLSPQQDQIDFTMCCASNLTSLNVYNIKRLMTQALSVVFIGFTKRLKA